jgi:hypothetical protein
MIADPKDHRKAIDDLKAVHKQVDCLPRSGMRTSYVTLNLTALGFIDAALRLLEDSNGQR